MQGSTYNSLELRWFMPGAMPEPLLATFESEGSTAARERRRDSYWQLHRVDIGVKRRNGGPVEMKVRRSARPWAMPSGSPAVSEQWNKWRPDRLVLEGQHGAWLDVDKELWTRTLGPLGHEMDSPADGRRARCEVELAALTLASTEWWTVGFEVTGPAAWQSSILRAAFDKLWSPTFERWLDGGVNAGYPEWLEVAAELIASR